MPGMWWAGVCFHFREPAWMAKPLTMHWLRVPPGQTQQSHTGIAPWVSQVTLLYSARRAWPGGWKLEGKEWTVSKTECVWTLSALLLFLFLLAERRGRRRHNKACCFPLHLQHCTYMKLPTLHAIEESLKRGRKINYSHLKSTPVFLLYGGASFAWDQCRHGNTCWGVNLVLYCLQATTRHILG